MSYDLRSIHDAELITVDVDTAGRTLSLRFRNADTTLVDFRFKEIRHLRIDGVFLQNVVSRAFLTPSARITAADVRTSLEWLYTFDKGVDAALVAAGGGIDNGTLKLFYVDPSIGAEVAVLCADVAVNEIPGEKP